MTPLQLGSVIPTHPTPPACFDETFVAGLVPYALISGNLGLFTVGATPYGQGVTVASQNSATASEIARPASSIATRTFSGKFNVLSTASDDAGVLYVLSGGALIATFNPRREAAFDTARRMVASLGVGGSFESIFLGAGGEITLGAWFQMDCTIVAGAGNSNIQITRLSDSAVVINQNFVSAHTPLLMDSIAFFADSGGTTQPTSWADIHLCP